MDVVDSDLVVSAVIVNTTPRHFTCRMSLLLSRLVSSHPGRRWRWGRRIFALFSDSLASGCPGEDSVPSFWSFRRTNESRLRQMFQQFLMYQEYSARHSDTVPHEQRYRDSWLAQFSSRGHEQRMKDFTASVGLGLCSQLLKRMAPQRVVEKLERVAIQNSCYA